MSNKMIDRFANDKFFYRPVSAVVPQKQSFAVTGATVTPMSEDQLETEKQKVREMLARVGFFVK